MERFGKYLAALFACALIGVMLAGCSGGPSSSAASSDAGASSSAEASSAVSVSSESAASEQLADEQLKAELEAIVDNMNYKSVSMDITGEVKMDLSSMQSLGDEGAESSGATEGSDGVKTIPMSIKAKCDISGEPMRMYLAADMMDMNYELYITGKDVVMVVDGAAYGATLEELGMTDYESPDSLMKSQLGDFTKFANAVESIEKTVEGEDTVYTVICDPEKFISSNGSMSSISSLSEMGISLDTVKVVYRANAEGLLIGVDAEMIGPLCSITVNATRYDYDATIVPEAPEATMSYSDLVNEG